MKLGRVKLRHSALTPSSFARLSLLFPPFPYRAPDIVISSHKIEATERLKRVDRRLLCETAMLVSKVIDPMYEPKY